MAPENGNIQVVGRAMFADRLAQMLAEKFTGLDAVTLKQMVETAVTRANGKLPFGQYVDLEELVEKISSLLEMDQILIDDPDTQEWIELLAWRPELIAEGGTGDD